MASQARIWSFPSFYPNPLPGRQWNGIFAHRQNLGLFDNGAWVSVVQPVKYKWPAPLDRIFHCDTDLNASNLPRKRMLDQLEVYHPVIADPRPSRLFPSDYGERYKQAVRRFFRRQGIRFGPHDYFFAQWLPEAHMVVELGREWGVTTGVMAIGDDVLVLPQASAAARDYLCQTLLAADLRFAVSNHLAAEACRIVGQPLDFTVVRRGVNHDVFKPADLHQRRSLRNKWGMADEWIVCLCVGTMLRAKGWLDLLDALQSLAPENPRLRLAAVHAGQSDLNLPYELERRGLQNLVIDLGEVKPGAMPELYQAADLFCLPSHSEGISNAVVEAMSAGLPVVTTELPGHRELVSDRENGLLIPVRDVPALTQALQELLNNPNVREQLASSARKFIVEQWGSFADNSRKILTAFEGYSKQDSGMHHPLPQPSQHQLSNQ